MSNKNMHSRVSFREDRFVQHTIAKNAIDEMKFVYDLSGHNMRPVNLAIIGEGGSGKTSLKNYFLSKTLNIEPDYSKFGFQQNISSFDLPPRVTPRKFLNNILNPKYPGEGNISLGQFAARTEELGLKLIIVDEFSELDRTHKNYRQEVLHTMKWIGNNLNIPFIVSGTNCINRVFKDDPQMSRRFKILRIEQWKSGREFEYFVYSYLKSLPGFEGLETLSKDLFDVLLSKDSQTTFDIVTKLGDAAYEAYRNQDIENIHIYARQIAMRSGNVSAT